MQDALSTPQNLLLLGGTSDIALEVARAWVARGCRRVVLAARPSEARSAAAAGLRSLGVEIEERDFEARDTDSHAALVRDVAATEDIDVAVVAFGMLGDADTDRPDHDRVVELAQVNYVGAVSVGVALAEVMRAQGHGVIVALSSVAGERVRRSNFVYGSSKAGMDGFYLGLGETLRGSGVRVLVVRPGFVHTSMTEGLDPAPLAVGPEQVAAAVLAGVEKGAELIWVPGPMRVLMSVLRHVPRAVFRRLPI